jgi:hypothetical protein
MLTLALATTCSMADNPITGLPSDLRRQLIRSK